VIVVKHCIFFFICFYAITAKAQIPTYIHYEVNDGLPSNEIYSLKQDKNGFLWIGTEGGLAKYNGRNFILYPHKNLKGLGITGIQEDAFGKVWCYNFSGQILHTQNDSLVVFKPWANFYKEQFADFALDNNNQIFVSNFKNNVYVFNIKYLNLVNSLSNNTTIKQGISVTHDNKIIFTNLTDGKPYIIEQNLLIPVPLKAWQNLPADAKAENTLVFFKSSKNLQTFAIQRLHPNIPFPSLYQFVHNQLQIHPVTAYLRKNKIHPLSVLNDDEGNLFIGTFNGCLWFKQQGENWNFHKNIFENNAVSAIIKDRENSYWFATLKNGLYQVPDLAFQIFTKEDIGILETEIGDVETDGKSKLFVSGSTNELFTINILNNKLVHKNFTKDKRYAQAFYYDKLFNRLLLYKSEVSILENNILKNISTLTSAAKNFYVRKDGVIFIAGSSLDAIFLTSNKNLTLTSEFGEVEKSNTELNKHNSNIWGRVVISTQRSRDVWYNEKDKILWSANSDGVVYYKNKKVNTLFDTKSNKQIIATCFQNLENNLLCIGTVDQGIYIIQDTSIVLHYTTKNGLQSNQINKIKADEQNIWAITDKGIQRFNLSTNNFINISKSDGLISNQVFDMAIANNTVYISTSKGLQFLPVNAIKTSNQLPFLGIKKVSINDSIYNYKNTILLNSKNGNIEIELEYALLKNSGNIALKYRMIGLDTLWIEDKAFNNIIRYNTLSSGSYKFEAVCMNDDGVESKPVTIHFTVLKPWWLQWWFLITAACISILLVIFFTKLYLNISKNKIAEELKKSKLQEEARQSQLASLKAQMNPHFMFNALNSIQEYILLSDKRLANMYLGKFADLMRLILDQSNKEIISLEEELKILNLYLELEALRFEENFEYIIQKENIEDEAEINIPAMLIQPYVENAIKHGLLHKQGLKKISIHFKLQKNKLLCVVEDNGIGRKRSGEINALRNKKYTSFATGATQKRLELLNQNNPNLIVVNYTDLTLNNTTYIGTKVSIVIPIIEL